MYKQFVLVGASILVLVGNSYGEWIGGTRGWHYSNADTNFYPWSTACRVGIGTADPGANLHINPTGNDAVNALWISNSVTPTSPYVIVNTGNGAADYQATSITGYADYVMSIGTRGGTPWKSLITGGQTILASITGNVGIGITSPTKTLQIGNSSNNASIYNDYISTINNMILEARDNNDGGAFVFRSNKDAGTTDLVKITRAGNVGIGTMSPGYKLTVSGTAWCTSGSWSGSDIRWKENVKTLPNPLEKVLKLRGVQFDWKHEEFKGNNFPEGRQIGIIAQELEKEFPELVETDEDGYKAIAYDRLTAVLLEAIKSQQEAIKEQQNEIEVLKSRLGQ